MKNVQPAHIMEIVMRIKPVILGGDNKHTFLYFQYGKMQECW